MLDIPLYTGFFLNRIHHHVYIQLKMQGTHGWKKVNHISSRAVAPKDVDFRSIFSEKKCSGSWSCRKISWIQTWVTLSSCGCFFPLPSLEKKKRNKCNLPPWSAVIQLLVAPWKCVLFNSSNMPSIKGNDLLGNDDYMMHEDAWFSCCFGWCNEVPSKYVIPKTKYLSKTFKEWKLQQSIES